MILNYATAKNSHDETIVFHIPDIQKIDHPLFKKSQSDYENLSLVYMMSHQGK